MDNYTTVAYTDWANYLNVHLSDEQLHQLAIYLAEELKKPKTDA